MQTLHSKGSTSCGQFSCLVQRLWFVHDHGAL